MGCLTAIVALLLKCPRSRKIWIIVTDWFAKAKMGYNIINRVWWQEKLTYWKLACLCYIWPHGWERWARKIHTKRRLKNACWLNLMWSFLIRNFVTKNIFPIPCLACRKRLFMKMQQTSILRGWIATQFQSTQKALIEKKMRLVSLEVSDCSFEWLLL